MLFTPQWLPAARLNLNHARKFSLLSTHASFPATMYRYQLQRKASMYDSREEGNRSSKDAVKVSEDGLVHAMISKSSPYSNGPIFMPNSRLLQQMLRFDFKSYQEEVSDGKVSLDPTVICIPRGTTIPAGLVLWREGVSRFSLQPSEPMEVGKLNEVLSEFYEASATSVPTEEWIEKHPYKESSPDQNEKEWMEK
ncbi:uncharacterized protein N7477_000376 [Penicillium maclennaniae]|uniref:uncharacterized protein n=1 Tax=Penicillium maclennaniae TaxID=1343394 RepID=UPI002541CCD5|nr:uncharacterized protein N7477_000376 [Penicillium maclennaniae]KAJ5684031.1 hypothetical protein N7477_000376 [Penicillium maclennaniae]